MHYTLHQLKIFLSVHKTKSITKAADDMHLTQPAISIQLKKLQDQFEIPLTEVIGRQLHITDFGHKIAEISTRILNEADGIKNMLNEYKGLLVGDLKISVVSTGKYVMPYFLNGFISKHPGVNVSVDVTNRAKVIESLSKNESDFSLVSVLPENIPIKRIELMSNKIYLVSSAENQPAKAKLKFKDLHNLPIIYREQGSATRAAMEKYITTNEIPVRKRLELVSNEAVKQAVKAGLGYSIMPLIGLKNELHMKEMMIIPTEGLPIITSWNLIYNRDKRLSPAANALLEYINEAKDQIMEKYFNWTEGVG
ncbi:MAG: LysR family transcriptional regulator [Cyclobacteriaceae bacterium]